MSIIWLVVLIIDAEAAKDADADPLGPFHLLKFELKWCGPMFWY